MHIARTCLAGALFVSGCGDSDASSEDASRPACTIADCAAGLWLAVSAPAIRMDSIVTTELCAGELGCAAATTTYDAEFATVAGLPGTSSMMMSHHRIFDRQVLVDLTWYPRDLQLVPEGEHVVLTVEVSDAEPVVLTGYVHYMTYEPNGPGCDPRCQQWQYGRR